MKRQLLAAGLLVGLSTSAEAQTYWRYSSAAFGATTGASLGVAAESMRSLGCILGPSKPECEPRAWVPVATGAMLGALGFAGGYSADAALARGEPLSEWTRFRLQFHLIATPAILAPVAVSALDPGPTNAGLKWAAAIGGAVAGNMLRRGLEPALEPSITPTGDGVRISFSASW